MPREPAEMPEKQLPLDPLQAKGRLRITQQQHNRTLSTAKKWRLSGSGDTGLHHSPSVQTALKQGAADRRESWSSDGLSGEAM